eukprot:TRINITY_DN33842_c0_g1_i1.p1 TRINITY_DN33842_c0_g1~~TRINITY_DN33842_c0_g1_i1.p1  ORF type:complete len:124 (-),score=13.30 TRINITY_DN33842_c0_g1_i1:367-738(-)
MAIAVDESRAREMPHVQKLQKHSVRTSRGRSTNAKRAKDISLPAKLRLSVSISLACEDSKPAPKTSPVSMRKAMELMRASCTTHQFLASQKRAQKLSGAVTRTALTLKEVASCDVGVKLPSVC